MVYTEEQLAEKIAKLPKYTVREEQANVITHFIGMIIGIIGLLIMFSFAIVRTIRVYGCTLYNEHRLSQRKELEKKSFQTKI